MPELPDAPWATKELPDAPWMTSAKPAAVPAAKSENYFGLIPMAKGIYKIAKSFASAPGDVLAGKLDPMSDEAIGRMTEGAMLASPMSAATRAGPAAVARAMTPSREAIETAAAQGFNEAKNMGVDIAPSAMRDLGHRLEAELQQKGILEEHAPTTYATLKRLQEPPSGSVSTISDIHNLRQAFGNAAGNITHPKDTLAGSMGKGLVDEYLSAIPAADVLAGDAAAASAKLKDAIGNSAAAFRTKDFDTRITKAERATDRQVAGSLDSQIKSKAGQMLDNPERIKGLSADEVAQLELINSGTPTSNILRQLGRGGAGVIPMAAHAATAFGTGGASIPFSLAVGTPLYAARKIAEAMTKSRASKLDEMLRSRAPLAEGYTEQVAAPGNSTQEILKVLLAAQNQEARR
jgi:hypothetical protein